MTVVDLLVVVALLGLAPAEIARRKGHSFGLWWLLGAAMFIVALPAALLLRPDSKTRQNCPWCRSSIDRQARVCPKCGRDVFAYYAEHGSGA